MARQKADKAKPGDGHLQRGTVFAIGGRVARGEGLEVLGQFVDCCGGPNARLALITTASREPANSANEYQSAFRSLGVDRVVSVYPESRERARSREILEVIESADGVFFGGGGQLKLVTTIGGTPLNELLLDRFHSGMHVGGTSAGAAALSAVMIAKGKGGTAPKRSSVWMSPGFGFITQAIIDQHFSERDRFGRLLAAVVCNPSMLGLGLDEGTAFALGADDVIKVSGRGSLTIVDGADLEVTNVNEVSPDVPTAFAGMRIHVLTAGWSYDVARRAVGEKPQYPR